MENSYLLQQKKLVKQLEEAFDRRDYKSTVVEMQKDYVNDDQMCLTSVVFIPDKISSKVIANITSRLKSIEPQHYFYPPESMHLTIKNIRTRNRPPLFSEVDIRKVDKLFSEVVPKFPVFEFNIEGIAGYPTSVSLIAYSDETLKKLILTLDKGLREIGVPDNKKYISNSVFWGNITICRFTEKPGSKFIDEVKKIKDLKIGKFKVEKISLITCNVACHPNATKIVGEYKLKKS